MAINTYIHHYKSPENWENFVSELPFVPSSESILIQVFASVFDRSRLDTVAKRIYQSFPEAAIIGTTTAGEIADAKLHENNILVVVTFFEKTVVHSASTVSDNSYILGEELAEKLKTNHPAAAILFVDGLNHNGDFFLQGFTKKFAKSVSIHGGMAGDGMHFKKTLVLHRDKWMEKGAVGVVLDSISLRIHKNYHLSWKPIGKMMEITKASSCRVWEIDNRPVCEVYQKYLGEEIARNMPASASLFPLLLQQDGISIARAITTVHSDGSATFAGDLPVGSQVRFGIGNFHWLLEDSGKTLHNLENRSVESIFIYSCAARKTFIGQEIDREFYHISQIAPTAGFFTYGEFYTFWDSNRLLNITTTVLGLSETYDYISQPEEENEANTSTKDSNFSKNLTFNALVHLISKVQEDFEKSEKELKRTKDYLNQYVCSLDEELIVSKTDSNGIITFVNQPFVTISGYKKEELIGKLHNILIDPHMPTKIFKSMWQTIRTGNVWKGELTNRKKDGTRYHVKSLIIPIKNSRGEVVEYICIFEDISNAVTGKIKKDRQNEFIKFLFNSVESIVMILRNEKVVMVNNHFYEILSNYDLESFKNGEKNINELFVEKEGFLSSRAMENGNWYDSVIHSPHLQHYAAINDRWGNEHIFIIQGREIVFENSKYIILSFSDITH
ncbi:FIST N-terminal domain-containing protein [Hydrogenimonas sp.]|uniref:FIST N-terminal domain-containing protein n=1 Tax=Hydrogenimonas sp. TaxID=2231112 RepID=UPI00261DCF77|nr:FIST N-terminal domain-containing protein [Hydrogenimonas sp.]